MSDFSEKLLAYTLWKNTFTTDPETWERQVKQAELWDRVMAWVEDPDTFGELELWIEDNFE